jgi:hypothetical protein
MLLAAALPLGACVVAQPYPVYGYGYGYGYPAAPVGSNAATGAAVGAMAGGLLGAAAANPYNRGGAALGGAAAGALVGGLIGHSVDQQNAEAAQSYGYGYAPPSDPAYGYGYASPYATEGYRY